MPEAARFDAALSAALAVIHDLEAKPHMLRQEKLAKITYAILHEIERAEHLWRAAGSSLPAPAAAADGSVTVQCRLMPAERLDDSRDGEVRFLTLPDWP